MSDDTELTALQVRFKKDGTLVQKQDGTDVIIGHYDRNTGHLEFETKEYSVKLYNQVTARIGTVNKGSQPSGLLIKSIGVKGEAKPSANAPKRPKMGPEGDLTPAVVDHYLKHNLTEAIVRYGIFLDKDGQPVRKKVKRIVEETVDQRDVDDDTLEWVRDGKKTQSRGPIGRKYDVVELKSAIVARRASRYEEGLEALFSPEEVIGGFVVDDDFEVATVAGEEDES